MAQIRSVPLGCFTPPTSSPVLTSRMLLPGYTPEGFNLAEGRVPNGPYCPTRMCLAVQRVCVVPDSCCPTRMCCTGSVLSCPFVLLRGASAAVRKTRRS
eukprot:2817456-Rhodomonas_salina.1